MNTVNVARDFTRYPSGRKIDSGPTSGEEFGARFLIPHLNSQSHVVIELDGTIGYGSSFLEEAFGGAVRKTAITAADFFKLVELRSKDPALVQEIHEYVVEAARSGSK